MKPDREAWWAAEYRGDGGLQVIEGVCTNECPVSFITGYSRTLVQISHKVTALTGVMSLGDADHIAAKMVDGLEAIAIEKSRAEMAIAEAGPRQREDAVEMED